ncbi:MAG TPA: TolC family protein [Prevotella sp.]|nr:TolC family protein [Prevotella sp.]
MKRIGLYIGLMALGSLEVTAQVATATHTAVEAIGETQAKIWGLDSCMAYAVEHATDVKREVVNARQRKQDYQKAVTDFLPSVAGGVQGQYAWGRNIDPETNTYNHVTTFNNYYQLYASLNVFDGFATINAFKQAKLARAYSTTAMQKVRDDKAIDVMQKFVDAAYAEASIQIASDKLAESKRLLGKMQRLYELGEKGRPDVVQMESQVAEDEYNLTHQKHVAQQSLLTLKSAMNFPVEEELRLVTNGKQVNESFPINHETVYQNFLNASPDVKSAEYEVEKARYDYKIAKGRLLPFLSLSGGISTNFYRNLSQGGQYEGFASQFRNNGGEYLALTLSIPIYDNVAWHSVKKARNDWQLAQVNLEETKRKLHDHIAQAVMDAEGYAKELYQMNKKVASDSLAYYMSSRKFEEGMLSTFDLHTAAQTLLESRIKQLQMQMLLVIKQRLVDYYQGKNLIK